MAKAAEETDKGLTCNLLLLTFVILLGTSLQFGYNIGVLNQPVNLIKQFYNQTYTARRAATYIHDVTSSRPVANERNPYYHATTDERTNDVTSSGHGDGRGTSDHVITGGRVFDVTPSGSANERGEGRGQADHMVFDGQVVDESMITFLWSLTTTMFLPGGMIGAFSAGYLADKLGRKRAVLVSNIPSLIGAILSASCVYTSIPELLMAGRFVTGLSCGFATQLAPMFLAEIAPFNLRGAFGTANQLFITLGICLGSVLGLQEILGTVDLWPYLLLVNAVPALLCLIVLPCMPDSPRYLMINRHDRQSAQQALRFIRCTKNVSADLEEMETECPTSTEQGERGGRGKEGREGEKRVGADNNDDEYTMCRLLRTSELRVPLLVAIFLQIIQQLSGINAIFFYSTGIYRSAGVADSAIPYAVVATNAVNVIMTVIAVPVMDKAGRRPLLIYPMAVMVVVMGLLVAAIKLQNMLFWASYVSIGCVLAYVVCFAVGLGPIPMMIGAELFRQGPRPRAMSLAGLVNWIFTAVVAMTFELVQEALHEYTFLIFLSLMILFTMFVFFKVPETKNKTFEEIASQFQPGDDLEVEELTDDVFDVTSKQATTFASKSGPWQSGHLGSCHQWSGDKGSGHQGSGLAVQESDQTDIMKPMAAFKSGKEVTALPVISHVPYHPHLILPLAKDDPPRYTTPLSQPITLSIGHAPARVNGPARHAHTEPEDRQRLLVTSSTPAIHLTATNHAYKHDNDNIQGNKDDSNEGNGNNDNDGNWHSYL